MKRKVHFWKLTAVAVSLSALSMCPNERHWALSPIMGEIVGKQILFRA